MYDVCAEIRTSHILQLCHAARWNVTATTSNNQTLIDQSVFLLGVFCKVCTQLVWTLNSENSCHGDGPTEQKAQDGSHSRRSLFPM
jgi:hypothetical protein